MFQGTIDLRSKATYTGFTAPQNYTMFVFDDTLVLAPLGSHGKLLGIAGAAGKGIGTAVNVVGKRLAKKQRSAQEEKLGGLPDDITVEQVIEQIGDAHDVSVAAIESLELTTAAYPPGQARGANLHFKFASKDVDPFVYKHLQKERQFITSDPTEGVELLTGVLKDKVNDKRRFWGKK
jgi:hypothetical protein